MEIGLWRVVNCIRLTTLYYHSPRLSLIFSHKLFCMKYIAIISLLALGLTANAQSTCFESKPHPMPAPSASAKQKMEKELETALVALQKNPQGLEELIWAGRRTAYLGRYEEAIGYFTKAIGVYPDEAAPYRHRGHRWISLRCYDNAIADLSKAVALIKGKKDVIEEDGMPNEKNIPTSTLQSNTWYHLGLAWYLKKDYPQAVKAFATCLAVSNNPDMYIATANWYYVSLRRNKEDKKASAFLKNLDLSAELIENKDYQRILLLYRNKTVVQDPLAFLKNEAGLTAASYGYGLGVYLTLSGEKAKAKQVFDHILQLPQWAAFGYIAAETEN